MVESGFPVALETSVWETPLASMGRRSISASETGGIGWASLSYCSTNHKNLQVVLFLGNEVPPVQERIDHWTAPSNSLSERMGRSEPADQLK